MAETTGLWHLRMTAAEIVLVAVFTCVILPGTDAVFPDRINKKLIYVTNHKPEAVATWEVWRVEVVQTSMALRKESHEFYSVKLYTQDAANLLVRYDGVESYTDFAIDEEQFKRVMLSVDDPKIKKKNKLVPLTVGDFAECVKADDTTEFHKKKDAHILFAIRLLRFAVGDCECTRCDESTAVRGLKKEIKLSDYGFEFLSNGGQEEVMLNDHQADKEIGPLFVAAIYRIYNLIKPPLGGLVFKNRFRSIPEKGVINMALIQKNAPDATTETIRDWAITKMTLVQTNAVMKRSDHEHYAIWIIANGHSLLAHFENSGEEITVHGKTRQKKFEHTIGILNNPLQKDGSPLTLGRLIECVMGGYSLKQIDGKCIMYSMRVLRFAVNDCECTACVESLPARGEPNKKIALTEYGDRFIKSGARMEAKEHERVTDFGPILVKMIKKYKVLFQEPVIATLTDRLTLGLIDDSVLAGSHPSAVNAWYVKSLEFVVSPKHELAAVKITTEENGVIVAKLDSHGEKYVRFSERDFPYTAARVSDPTDGDDEQMTVAKLLNCVQADEGLRAKEGHSILFAVRLLRFAVNDCECIKCDETASGHRQSTTLELSDYGEALVVRERETKTGFSSLLARAVLGILRLFRSHAPVGTRSVTGLVSLKKETKPLTTADTKAGLIRNVELVMAKPDSKKPQTGNYGAKLTTDNGKIKLLARLTGNREEYVEWSKTLEKQYAQTVAFVSNPISLNRKRKSVWNFIDCVVADVVLSSREHHQILYAIQILRYAAGDCECRKCTETFPSADRPTKKLQLTDDGLKFLAAAASGGTSAEMFLASTIMERFHLFRDPLKKKKFDNRVKPSLIKTHHIDSHVKPSEIATWEVRKVTLLQTTRRRSGDAYDRYSVKLTTPNVDVIARVTLDGEEYTSLGQRGELAFPSTILIVSTPPLDAAGKLMTIGKFIECVRADDIHNTNDGGITFAIRLIRYAAGDCECTECDENSPGIATRMPLEMSEYGIKFRDSLGSVDANAEPGKLTKNGQELLTKLDEIAYLFKMPYLAYPFRFNNGLVNMDDISKSAGVINNPLVLRPWIVLQLSLVQGLRKGVDVYGIKLSKAGSNVALVAHIGEDGEEYTVFSEKEFPVEIAKVVNPKNNDGKLKTFGEFIQCVKYDGDPENDQDGGIGYAMQLLRFALNDCECTQFACPTSGIAKAKKIELTADGEKMIASGGVSKDKPNELLQHGELLIEKLKEVSGLFKSFPIIPDHRFSKELINVAKKAKQPDHAQYIADLKVADISIVQSITPANPSATDHYGVKLDTSVGIVVLAHVDTTSGEVYTTFDQKAYPNELAKVHGPLRKNGKLKTVGDFLKCVNADGLGKSEQANIEYVISMMEFAINEFDFKCHKADAVPEKVTQPQLIAFTTMGSKILITGGKENGDDAKQPTKHSGRFLQKIMELFQAGLCDASTLDPDG